MDPNDTKQKLLEMLRGFETVMVATNAENGTLHARPMAVGEVDDAGEVWFVSPRGTEKLDEARADNRAVVTAQAPGRYCSVSGELDVIHDPDRARALWSASAKPWLAASDDGAPLVLMRLRPRVGEYWDERGSVGARYLFDVARSLLDGESAEPRRDDPSRHAKVAL